MVQLCQKLMPENIHLKEHKIFVKQAKGMKDRITYSTKILKTPRLKILSN